MNINYDRTESLVELKDLYLEIQKVVEEIEKIDTNKETDIAKYLKEIKALDDYRYLKESIYDEYVMGAEKSESLGSIQRDLDLGDSVSSMNALIVGQSNRNLKQHTDYILGVEIPVRYKGKL